MDTNRTVRLAGREADTSRTTPPAGAPHEEGLPGAEDAETLYLDRTPRGSHDAQGGQPEGCASAFATSDAVGCAVSRPGSSHLEVGVECQDYSLVGAIDVAQGGGRVFCAIASDGVGSARLSADGSRIAATAAMDFLRRRLGGLPPDPEVTFDRMTWQAWVREAFVEALTAVYRHAEEAGVSPASLDATLDVVLLTRHGLAFWGHSGDGGIIARRGRRTKVLTRRLGGRNGSVYPLRFADTWEFGCAEGVESVLLATDGMFNVLTRRWPCGRRTARTREVARLAHVAARDGGQDELARELSGQPMGVSDDKTVAAISVVRRQAGLWRRAGNGGEGPLAAGGQGNRGGHHASNGRRGRRRDR